MKYEIGDKVRFKPYSYADSNKTIVRVVKALRSYGCIVYFDGDDQCIEDSQITKVYHIPKKRRRKNKYHQILDCIHVLSLYEERYGIYPHDEDKAQWEHLLQKRKDIVKEIIRIAKS